MRPDPEVARFLTSELGAGHPNRAFADAVVFHVGQGVTANSPPLAVARRVVELLRPGYNSSHDPAELLAWPELMASLFQNADLLAPGDPGSRAISKLVMSALASIDEG